MVGLLTIVQFTQCAIVGHTRVVCNMIPREIRLQNRHTIPPIPCTPLATIWPFLRGGGGGQTPQNGVLGTFLPVFGKKIFVGEE